jgi:hypothetical protein
MLLSVVSGFVSLLAAIAILFTEHYPQALYSFQYDLVAWIARVLVYHASLVDTYPPFSLAAGHAARPPVTGS